MTYLRLMGWRATKRRILSELYPSRSRDYEAWLVLGDADVLANHALYMVAVELNEHPDADLVYSDEDGIDEGGRRHDPRFKPDWNLDLFCARNMIGRLAVYRVQTVHEAGGLWRRGGNL